jgi:hypothetical protein
LKGTYDFDLKWTSRSQLAAAGADGISVFDAVDKQLGLKLDLQKTPLRVVVVESVDEKPTENEPDIGKILPGVALPTEFEVADVKLTPADAFQAANAHGRTADQRLYADGGKAEDEAGRAKWPH